MSRFSFLLSVLLFMHIPADPRVHHFSKYGNDSTASHRDIVRRIWLSPIYILSRSARLIPHSLFAYGFLSTH
jgi:hypothetical protein